MRKGIWILIFTIVFSGLVVKYFMSEDITQQAIELKNKGDLQDAEEAIAEYCKVLELDSCYLYAYLNLAYRYNEVGNHEKELEIYKKGLDICRKNPNPLFYINYGTSLLEQELINEGIDIYTEGINTFSDNKELYLRRGVAYMMRDNPDDRVYALLDFTQSYELGHEKALDMINRLHSY